MGRPVQTAVVLATDTADLLGQGELTLAASTCASAHTCASAQQRTAWVDESSQQRGHDTLPQTRGSPSAHTCSALGAALAPGDALAWHSSGSDQGTVPFHTWQQPPNNGCAAKGTCGRAYSTDGLGGGWELCFA